MRVAATVLAILAAATPATASLTPDPISPKSYAHMLAAKRGWTGSQWRALNQIVTAESGWNPCASYPRRSDCSYSGGNSCGIPQRNPCPTAWRGRLWQTRYQQVRELLRYISERYGSPLAALSYRQRKGWY